VGGFCVILDGKKEIKIRGGRGGGGGGGGGSCIHVRTHMSVGICSNWEYFLC